MRLLRFPCAALFIAVAAVVALAGTTLTASAAEPNPIDALKPGEWYEVPDSHLEDVAPSPSKFPWLSGNVSGVTSCWAGGAFDTQRDRLLLGPGGGHAGYNGNEVYAFDLNELKWRRLNDPDPVIPGTEYTEADVAPFAMHTYDGVEYLPPPVDRYVVIGGWGTERTYALNPDRPDRWEVYADHGTGRTGDLCAYDPNSGHLWLSTPITAGKLLEWDPLAQRWTMRRNDSPDPSYYETADVDWNRHLLVSCGKGKLKTWGLAPPPAGVPFEELKPTGDTQVMDHPSPGFCYVPQRKQFVGWASGPDVYTLDLDAKRWTRHAPAATNKVLPGAPDQWGTFGRFRYVPSKNVFVVCNSVKQNVFIYRLDGFKPNVITAVEARLTGKPVESDLDAPALAVEAVYADGTRRDVTAEASYFSLTPAVASASVHDGGVVHGLTPGAARLRVVYTDPNYKRGYEQEVALAVVPVSGKPTLESLKPSAAQLTIVAGDHFQLEATGRFRRGNDYFDKRLTGEVQWSSSASEVATVEAGLIKTVRGGPVRIEGTYQGQRLAAEVNVVGAPVIQRIAFQVKPEIARTGWLAENGQLFSETRGYGWLNVEGLATRDDRDRARAPLLKCFVHAPDRLFRVRAPRGTYTVRMALGDADYGAVPFAEFIAQGDEKLLYYEGRRNDVATRVVHVDDDEGLVLRVNGKINYLVIAPLGIDLDKYAYDAN